MEERVMLELCRVLKNMLAHPDYYSRHMDQVVRVWSRRLGAPEDAVPELLEKYRALLLNTADCREFAERAVREVRVEKPQRLTGEEEVFVADAYTCIDMLKWKTLTPDKIVKCANRIGITEEYKDMDRAREMLEALADKGLLERMRHGAQLLYRPTERFWKEAHRILGLA